MTDSFRRYGQYSEAEATEAAYNDGFKTVRIARRDDQRFVGTRDLRSDRVNFEIENDRVVKAWIS